MANSNHHRILTPINRRNFFNKTYCKWTIKTNRNGEKVVLTLSAFDIEEENGLTTLTRFADFTKESNMTVITIQVSMPKTLK